MIVDFQGLKPHAQFKFCLHLQKEAPASLLKSLLIGSQQVKEGELDDLIKERPRTEAKLKG